MLYVLPFTIGFYKLCVFVFSGFGNFLEKTPFREKQHYSRQYNRNKGKQ